MNIGIPRGLTGNGIVFGYAYKEYGSKNPFVRWIIKARADALPSLVAKARPQSIHEIGCGEGFLGLGWNKRGIDTCGSDFFAKVLEIARENSKNQGVLSAIFIFCSIYGVEPGQDSADLIVPQRVATDYVIVSVPGESIWCALSAA